LSLPSGLKQSSHTQRPQTGQLLKWNNASMFALAKAAWRSCAQSMARASSFSTSAQPPPANGAFRLVQLFPQRSQKKLNWKWSGQERSADFFVSDGTVASPPLA
jgi:hypothetical protein